MLKLTQRYLAHMFLGPFLIGTSFFVSFLLTFQLFRIADLVINKGVEWAKILEIMGHICVSFLPMAIPISVLFSIIYTLNKLSEDSEVVAMRSFGLTKHKLFTPFLILGIFISAVLFALNLQLIPHSKRMFKNSIIKLTSKGMLAEIKAGRFFTDLPGIILFSEKVEEGGTNLNNVFIQVQGKDAGTEKIIFAKKGILFKEEVDEWENPKIRLKLYEGNIFQMDGGQKSNEKIVFLKYDFPILTSDLKSSLVTRYSMMTSSQLAQELEIKKGELQKLEVKGTKRNRDEHDLYWDLKKRIPKIELEYWTRINNPILVMLFILLGFGLGVKRGRGKSKSSGPVSLLVLVLYYAIFFLGFSFARKGKIPATLAVLGPSLILGFFGIYYYRQFDWRA